MSAAAEGVTRVGWIGLGKLGLPCALTMESLAQGSVAITGFDTAERVVGAVEQRTAPWAAYERDLDKLLESTELRMVASITEVVEQTDGLIFCAVQTPHGPEYGGEQPMPEEPADFDYTALRAVATAVNTAAQVLDRQVTLVVISTALPGTMRREVAPLLTSRVRLVYNPFFIAMGTTVADFSDPEFVLVGSDDPAALGDVAAFYSRLYGDTVPVLTMRIEEAELTKVAYNTYISMKIVFANALQELCDTLGLSVDTVTGALGHAHRRLISTAYLSGGVGDGGACHPRDGAAMSWLAQRTGASVDVFEFVTRAREAQSEWLADLAVRESVRSGRPIVVLGKAYKPGSSLTYGSQGALLVNQLRERGIEVADWWDPQVDRARFPHDRVAVFVIMTQHPEFAGYRWLPGSTVIDPFRYIPPRDGMTLRRIGERR